MKCLTTERRVYRSCIAGSQAEFGINSAAIRLASRTAENCAATESIEEAVYVFACWFIGLRNDELCDASNLDRELRLCYFGVHTWIAAKRSGG